MDIRMVAENRRLILEYYDKQLCKWLYLKSSPDFYNLSRKRKQMRTVYASLKCPYCRNALIIRENTETIWLKIRCPVCKIWGFYEKSTFIKSIFARKGKFLWGCDHREIYKSFSLLKKETFGISIHCYLCRYTFFVKDVRRFEKYRKIYVMLKKQKIQ